MTKEVPTETGGVEAEVERRSPVMIERCPEEEELAEESWTEDLSVAFPVETGVESWAPPPKKGRVEAAADTVGGAVEGSEEGTPIEIGTDAPDGEAVIDTGGGPGGPIGVETVGSEDPAGDN